MISAHFSEAECKCKCGCGQMVVNQKLVSLMEKIREKCGGKPVTVLSWNRCKKHNTAIGGAADSQHVKGTACDIRIAGVSVDSLAKTAETCGAMGVGRYPSQGFVHVDVRATAARWNG